MIYSQLYLNNQRRIPTVLGVLIVCLVLFFFVRLFFRPSIPSRASLKSLPRMEIANLLPNQATIYWQSSLPEKGWIVFGESEQLLSNVALDERDILDKKNNYKNHSVILRNLKDGTKYFFKIVSDNQLIGQSGNRSFTLVTPKSDSSIKSREPAYGKVFGLNNAPLENAAVILRLEKAYPLLILTKSTGEWLIPLNAIYETSTLKSRTIGDDEVINMDIIGEDGTTSAVTTNNSKISPLPQTVIIGKNYDFLHDTNVLGVSDTEQAGGMVKQDIRIIYPEENAFIHGFRPLLKGMALPGDNVIVMVQGSTNISQRVTADDQGIWQANLSTNLIPGQYTIVVMAKNRQNSIETLKRRFSIVPNDIQQVLGVATAEPTLTGLPTPTSGLTNAPTPLPTYQQATVTMTPQPPVSGLSPMMPLIGGASLIIVGVGLLLVF